VIYAPPDRAMMETVSVRQNNTQRPQLPIVSLYQAGDIPVPANKATTAKLRKLGYSKAYSQNKLKIRQGRHPVPVHIPYVLDVWAETAREARLLVQELVWLGGSNAEWLRVWAGTVFGWKVAYLNFGGTIGNNTNLEALGRSEQRLVRYTLPFELQAWVFDPAVYETDTMRQVRLRIYSDTALTTLVEDLYYPRRQYMGDADGLLTTFSYNYGLPLQMWTVLVIGTVAGVEVTGFDDGDGNIAGTGITSGTVNYVTGEVAVTFDTAPDNLTEVKAGYLVEE